MKNPYESVKNILQSVNDGSLPETQMEVFTSIEKGADIVVKILIPN